jgi:AcrR family transcriptional regulator
MRLFAERGAAAVSVRDVADAAGVSPSLVIHHYKTKDGLKGAVDERATATLIEVVAELADAGPVNSACTAPSCSSWTRTDSRRASAPAGVKPAVCANTGRRVWAS